MSSLKSYFAVKGSRQADLPSRPNPPIIQILPDSVADRETKAPESDSSIPSCSYDCCNLDSPAAARLAFDKERSARTHGKRKRYFQPDWLNKFPWLVLCNTDNRAYCQTCRYVQHASLQSISKNGIDAFTVKGFCNWKDGMSLLTQHNDSQYHRDACMVLQQKLNGAPINEQIDTSTKLPSPVPMSRVSFGDASDNTSMFGGLFVLLAAWGLGGNLLLCALLYQNNLWTLMNRGFMAISLLGIFQSVTCLLPVGVSGIREAWSFSDPWCASFPFLNRFSQMSLLYFVVLLLVYNIYSLNVATPPQIYKTASIWISLITFILPYIIFLPPAMVFNQTRNATQLQEDIENLHACTRILVDYSYQDTYGAFRAVETIIGLIVPYVAVITLFIYLVFRISQRKGSKVRDVEVLEKKVSNVYRANIADMDTHTTTTRASFVTSTTINGDTSSERDEMSSPIHTKESLAIRSDKQSEVVVYVVSVCAILFFAPYIYQIVCEIADPSYPRTGNGLLRFMVHLLSYMVILVYPTIYTLQYPTIKESLVKLDILNLK